MACPFFAPSQRLENIVWVRPPRYPLGDLFSGTCHASASNLTEGHHDECCNFGYARGRCDRFPGDDAADAVRFSVTEDSPARLVIVYVVEKDHAPVEFGTLEYAVADARLDGSPISDVLVQQARAFLESYLHRRAGNASA
ncbi:MAG TPA: hypothetical protein VGQ49_19860 [Bryobacteraceae bacterium]|nr:hypothetical protein [Bryobacteraceae bacterium]